MNSDVGLWAAVLACYGLSYTITRKDGPGDLLLKLRVLLGAYDTGQNGQPTKWTGRFIICPYCVGVWVALLILTMMPYPAVHPFIWWWAIAGGQFLFQRGVRGG